MRTLYSKMKLVCLLAISAIAFTACSKDDDNPTSPTNTKENFIIMTADVGTPGIPGYLTAYDKMPSGEIENNIIEGSLSTQGSGFYTFGKYAFQRIRASRDNATVTGGIQRYSINASGKLEKDGFIGASQANFFIYSNELGFYLDTDRGLLKIQTFNPSTMQRTGEIDLSSTRDTKYEYQAVAENILISKGNKLYASMVYGSKEGKGTFFKDQPLGFADLVVIDIPSLKYEKTIRTDKVSYLGISGNHNSMWTLGDDGALYLCSHGFYPQGAKGSAIVRIKKNETEFDANWVLKADDYTQGTSFGDVEVKNGKLYTAIGSEPINFKTITSAVVYDYYEFDVNNITKKGTKVKGLPSTLYAFQNGHTIVNIKGDLYFNVSNNDNLNAYYKLEGDTPKVVFNVKKGGRIMGFARLAE